MKNTLDDYLRFIIGTLMAFTLAGSVFAILYSLIFVTQPVDLQAPNDKAFFDLVAGIAGFLTGTLSGVMLSNNKKEDKK